MPVSLACLCCSLVSSCSWRLITSSLVAGVLETLCTHCWPPSLQSRGGRIELRISSVFWSLWVSTDGSFALGGLGTGPPLPITATALCWPAFGVRTYTHVHTHRGHTDIACTCIMPQNSWKSRMCCTDLLPVRVCADQLRIVILDKRSGGGNQTHLDLLFIAIVTMETDIILKDEHLKYFPKVKVYKLFVWTTLYQLSTLSKPRY